MVKNESFKKVPNLSIISVLPDFISPFLFLTNPDKLLNRGRGYEIFSFRLILEKWFFLQGGEAIHFFGQLPPDDIDVFAYRKRMVTLELPGAPMPDNLLPITRAGNQHLKNFLEQVDSHEINQKLEEAIRIFLNRELAASGTIKDFYRFIIHLTTYVLGSLFLTRKVFDQVPADLGHHYADIDASLRLSHLLFPILYRKKNSVLDSKAHVVKYLFQLLADRKAKQESVKNSDCIMDAYIELQKQFNLSDGNTVWLFNALQWAGIHYSSVHAFWLGVKILSNPPLLADLIAEQKEYDVLDWDAVQNMKHLDGAIRESIRLTSIYAIPRHVLRDIVYKDYLIPKGSILAISPYLEHTNPAVFPDPEMFKPERWQGSKDDLVHASFIPGGLGLFGCLGMNLSIHYLTVLWAYLLRNYQFAFNELPPQLKKSLILIPPPFPVPLGYKKT